MLEQNELIRIVTALQAGDQNAAADLYDHFQENTYFFIKTMVTDPDLAADLTQDTFLTVLEKVNTLQQPAAFPGWLRQIAYNKATNYFKKAKDLTVDESEDGYSVFDTLEEDRTEFIPDAALDQEDFKATILAMLLELPETQRSAMVLRYYEEYSVKEIAEIQGVSEGTVKSRLNYGRNAIRSAVETYEKKTGVKLHCTAIVPLLLWLFAQGVLVRNTTVPAAAMGASAASASAGGSSASASGAAKAVATGAKVAAAGAKKGVVAAIIAAVSAVVVVAGIVAAVVLPKLNWDAEEIPDDEDTHIRQDEEEDEKEENAPSGNYTIWMPQEVYTAELLYVQDKQIFYHSPEGPVQLTQEGFLMTEQEIYDLWPGIFPSGIRFSQDMRYVYYPDGIVADPQGMNGISCGLYFRDLADPAAQPVKIAQSTGGYSIREDGLRVCVDDWEQNAFLVYDLDSNGITQTYQVCNYLQDNSEAPMLWNDELSTFIYRNADDYTRNVFAWHNGSSTFLGEEIVPYIPLLEDGKCDHCYYDYDGVIYRLEMDTLEVIPVVSDVGRLLEVDANDGLYYINYGPHLRREELAAQLIDFDNGEPGEFPFEVDTMHLAHYETVDYYCYRDGESVCLASGVNNPEMVGNLMITGSIHPELVEKVKASEYGEDVYKEAFRRLNQTYCWTISSETDSIEIPVSQIYQGPYIPDVSVNREELTDELYLMIYVREDETYYKYSIPVNEGKFGEGTLKQSSPAELAQASSIFYADYNQQQETYDLYFRGDLMLEDLSGVLQVVDGNAVVCTQYDRSTGLGTYCLIDENGQMQTIAENTCWRATVNCNEELYYLITDDPDSYQGDLYWYRDGESVLQVSGVQICPALMVYRELYNYLG